MSGRLTAAFVKSVRHRGGRARADRHHDGGHGLFLQVMLSGSKQWRQRLSLDGKRNDCGLGVYPFMGLAEARRKAFENALAAREHGRAVTRGEHPGLPAFEVNRLATVATKTATRYTRPRHQRPARHLPDCDDSDGPPSRALPRFQREKGRADTTSFLISKPAANRRGL